MILVFGSLNADFILPVKNFPAPGETVLTRKAVVKAGGKGANQAAAAACAGGLFLNPLVTRLVGAKVSSVNGHMSWWQSIVICAILAIVVTAAYAGLLWLMRVEEFSSLNVTMKARLMRRTSTSSSVSTPAES